MCSFVFQAITNTRTILCEDIDLTQRLVQLNNLQYEDVLQAAHIKSARSLILRVLLYLLKIISVNISNSPKRAA